MTRATAARAPRGPGRSRGPWADTPAHQTLVREHNLALVLSRIVEADAPPTRAQIAQGTGLTRATVSDLVETLVDAELVTELAPRAGERAGRPGVPLAPARRTVVGVGAEVAVDHLGVTVVDLTGMSVTQRIVEGDFRLSRSDKVLDRLGRLLASVVTEVKAQGMRPAGVCLAVPGLIEHPSSILRYAPNLGWTDVAVLDQLARASGVTGVRWTAGNDADLSARAECRARARVDGRPVTEQNFVYIGGFVGIGGAVVRHGSVGAGTHGWGGEIGHSPVHPEGPDCSCGATGCLEQYAGLLALLRNAGLPATESVQAVVDLLDAPAPGPERAMAALMEAASALGRAASTMVNIVDVGTVVLGGFYAPLIDLVGPRIQAELDRRVLGARWQPVRLERAIVDELPTLQGAAVTVLETVLAMPASWDTNVMNP